MSDPTSVPQIHISDIHAFKRCRRAWSWSSSLRRGLRRRRPVPALWIGTAVHAALDVHFSTGLKPVEALQDWLGKEKERLQTVTPVSDWPLLEGKLQEWIATAELTLEQYGDWEPKAVPRIKEVIAIELSFVWPVADWVSLAGRIDGLVKTKDGIWILEHKTVSGWWPDDYMLIDDQSTAYAAAMSALGYDVQGVIYTFLMKRKVRSQNPARRVSVSKSSRERELFRHDFLSVAAEMLDPMLSCYPAPNMGNCRFCDFVDPCAALQAGFSPEPWLRRNTVAATREEDIVDIALSDSEEDYEG